MKLRSFLPSVLALIASLTLVGFRAAGTPVDHRVNASFSFAFPGPTDGVWICHFAGHEGPNSHDFVTFNSPPNTTACDEEGGNPIHVARAACWHGHDAIARFGKDCDTTDQP